MPFQQIDEVGFDRFDLGFTVRAALLDLFGDLFIFIRVYVTEPQVFELPFDLPDT